MATTEERVIAIVREQLGIGFPIETGDSFFDALGMDPADGDAMVIALEESFNISIDYNPKRVIDLFHTVGDLIQYIDRLVAEQS
jgi:acyl carrier protein